MTAMALEVRAVSDGAAWDACVRASEGWTHFHLWGWKRVMEEALGHDCAYLGAFDEDGALRGVLPLVRVESAVFGRFLMSMPFVNYGGPLGDDEAVRALAAAALRLAAERSSKLLELRSRRELPLDLPASHRKVTVVLDVPEDSERLWQELKSKVRSQVRRPMKEGVEVRFGADQVDAFHGVFARHMRDLGTPVQSVELFRAIAREFPDDAWFAAAYLGEEPVAGACGFRWADEFEITWASSLREHNRIAPNMLLYWALMERCSREGVRTFNFGRCTPGGNTHRFKLQWGGRDEPLFWYQSPAGASAPSPDGGVFELATRLWSRLPLPVANALGPRIVRFIP